MLDWVTDGGLETDLIFHRGVELAEFAAFPLVLEPSTAGVLMDYFRGYVAIADEAGAGLVLETPTWRASADWGVKLGYGAAGLDQANRAAVDLVRRAANGVDRARVSGCLGPRGDGYVASSTSADDSADYHQAQIASLVEAGVDVVHAMTLASTAEAIGVVRAARGAGVSVGISFTVETDGRLPGGASLGDAIAQVDAEAAPDWFGVNCAHPEHIRPALDGGAWVHRLRVLRPNASIRTHEELDAMEVLDEGDRDRLIGATGSLLDELPAVSTLGGCCGTDSTHVAALWRSLGPRRADR